SRAPETPPIAPPPPENWYFDGLSRDGRNALLRRLDPRAHTTVRARIVDVDSGATLDDAVLDEFGRMPYSRPTASTTPSPTGDTELETFLRAPAFGGDLVRAGRIARAFPFGSCGRLATPPTNGGALAFNAGDFLYVADEAGQAAHRLVDDAAYDPRFT